MKGTFSKIFEDYKDYLGYNSFVIFLSGGVVLSLELLSSRIMTPYFGVSLYIWAGILSITLIALSLGYQWGGKVSSRFDEATIEGRCGLENRFYLLLAESSISIGISCILYPWLFYNLARLNILLGAFMAAITLLFIPLVFLSAMNPLLIEIRNTDKDHHLAGQRAGNVFFISTVGSVAGVMVTAFLFIPKLNNYTAVLTLGILLSLLSLGGWLRSDESFKRQHKRVLVLSLLSLILCAALIVVSPYYLKKKSSFTFAGKDMRIEKEYTSVFGNIKIVNVNSKKRYYYLDGAIQGIADLRGQSTLPYSYGLEALAIGAKPKAGTALVVGLAGGMIPMRLVKRGLAVDVVEINHSSLDAAREFYNFDESSLNVYLSDARNFVKACPKDYDVVLVDIPQGDALPEYLLSKEFFHDIKGCLADDGLAVFNTVADKRFKEVYYPVLKTLMSEFQKVEIFHEDNAPVDWPFTVYVAASDTNEISPLQVKIREFPADMQKKIKGIFKAPKPIDEAFIRKAGIITDELNFIPSLSAKYHLIYRQARLSSTHPLLLVN